MSEYDDLIKAHSRNYHNMMSGIEDQLAEAMINVYERITGKKGSDKFKEEIMEAIRYHG